MGRQNFFTTVEVDLIRKHWPTRMPIGEVLAMLPRHTENSVAQYANKVLLLSRPIVRQIKPAWDRVRDLIKAQPMTQMEIAEAMGFSRKRASEILKLHRDEVHICDWRWPEGLGNPEGIWTLGAGPDAPKPMGAQRARRLAVRRINPFFTAAGLVQAPQGQQGRVYQQDMTGESLEDRRAAA